MQIAQWSKDYEIGFPIIDQQHQQMFALVKQLEVLRGQEADSATLKPILQTLLNDTIAHFTLEENLMQQHGYPFYDQHKQIHDRLTQKISKILDYLEANEDKTFVNNELSRFLHQWLVHHIQGQDRKMIQFFRDRNIVDAQKQTIHC